MNDRLYDILSASGLTSQVYQGDFSSIPTTISFELFDKMQRQERQKALSLLQKALSTKRLN